MKPDIVIHRATIELLINVLDANAKDSDFTKGQLSILKSILKLFETER